MKKILFTITLVFASTASSMTLDEFNKENGFESFVPPTVVDQSKPEPEELEPAWFEKKFKKLIDRT
jgi:hypothetical protein